MQKKNFGQLAACVCLLLLMLSFIWGNSLLPGSESSEVSSRVMLLVKKLLGETIPVGEFVIRKLAHFTEFACLGLLLTWFFKLLGQNGIHGFTMPMLFGGIAALTDETLQMLTPARGPSLVDVWIDVSGVVVGILFLHLICGLWQERKNNKLLEETKQ